MVYRAVVGGRVVKGCRREFESVLARLMIRVRWNESVYDEAFTNLVIILTVATTAVVNPKATPLCTNQDRDVNCSAA